MSDCCRKAVRGERERIHSSLDLYNKKLFELEEDYEDINMRDAVSKCRELLYKVFPNSLVLDGKLGGGGE